MKVMKAMKAVEATIMKKAKDRGKVAAAEKINYSKVAKALKRELGKDGGLDEVTGATAKTSMKKPAATSEEEKEAGKSADDSDATEVADSLEYLTLKDHKSTWSSLLRPSNLPALVEICISGEGIAAHVLFNVEKCGAMVGSGWLLFGEVIGARTKGVGAALKPFSNANQKLVVHLCESSPKKCKFVDDKKVVFHCEAIRPRVHGDEFLAEAVESAGVGGKGHFR